MKKALITLLATILFIGLFIIVGIDERHYSMECTVVTTVTTTETNIITVETPTPVRRLYDFYSDTLPETTTLKVTFDSKGTETNPYDDEIVGVEF